MQYGTMMSIYLKSIVVEILLFLFLCAFIVVIILLASKCGWVNHKVSRIVVVSSIVLWLLFFIFSGIDIFDIIKDISSNDFVQEKVIFLSDEEYNLGAMELYSRKYVHCKNESGEVIKLWINNDVYPIEPTFEGTIIYSRRSRCIVFCGY